MKSNFKVGEKVKLKESRRIHGHMFQKGDIVKITKIETYEEDIVQVNQIDWWVRAEEWLEKTNIELEMAGDL